MGKNIYCSRTSILAPSDEDFVDQKLLIYEETNSFDDDAIESLKTSEGFPANTVFKPFDA